MATGTVNTAVFKMVAGATMKEMKKQKQEKA